MNPRMFVLAGIALSAAAPAFAHHSFAMFDRAKVANMSGTVKEYEWTNPHVWIHVTVPDAQGTPREEIFITTKVRPQLIGDGRRRRVAHLSVTPTSNARAFLGRRSWCPAGGDSTTSTAPESRVPRAAAGGCGGRLRRPGAAAGEGRAHE